MESERINLGQDSDKKYLLEVLEYFKSSKVKRLTQANAEWLDKRTAV